MVPEPSVTPKLSSLLLGILVLHIIVFSQQSVANDTAAEVATGGIQFKKDNNFL